MPPPQTENDHRSTQSKVQSSDDQKVYQQQNQEESTMGDPYEPLAFPYWRLDLTPASKLPPRPSTALSRWLVSLVPRRRINVTYFDGKEYISSSSIMARLWRIAADGIPMIAAFPRAQQQQPQQHAVTIRQFVDLLDFLQQHVPGDSSLTANYEDMDGIPVIRFTAASSSRSSLSTTSSPTSSTNRQHYNAPTIERRIQAWVDRVLVKMQICPFTKSVKYSGQGAGPAVPVAKIYYGTSDATTVTAVLADVWRAMDDMLVAGPTNISSILLAAPYFDNQFRLWSGPVFTVLEHSVIAARATADLGVVCFHPLYQTPDGSSFPGFGHMHSVSRLQHWAGLTDRRLAAAGGAWQRRTPHAVINVLRAEQLVAAESLRNTPDLYRDNIHKLLAIRDELPMALAHERQLE
jgi:hypothetical protein